MTRLTIYPENVCSDRLLVDIDENGNLETVVFEGGCPGNGRALGRLLRGMPAEKAAGLLRGVCCDDKDTSCADQLAQGLEKILSKGDGEH